MNWQKRYGYDKPVDVARAMCEVPNYMFPEIGEGECVEFESTGKL